MSGSGDYISRKTAYQFFKDQLEEETGAYSKGRNAGLRVAMSAVMNNDAIPAADVRPVRRGKWIPDYDYAEYDFDGSTPLSEPRKFQDGWQCSLCGGYMLSETTYCPNCGADMREES